MLQKGFSKIWIFVVAVAIAGGGVLISQDYFREKIKTPEFLEPETMEIKIYLNKGGENDCTCDNPVARTIPKGQAEEVTRAALEELVKGPTQEERTRNYYACLPTQETIRKYKEAWGEEYKKFYGREFGNQIEINNLKIENSIAYVDFSNEISAYGGGSCWVESIKSSINNTLKQLPFIGDVVISVEGQTENILQP